MAEPMEKGMSGPEFSPRPENGRESERPAEKPREQFGATQPASEPVAPVSAVQASAVPVPSPDPVVSSIETILSEDMYEHFEAMPPDLQEKFRKKGEETVSRLARMVEGTVIKAKEVLLVIVVWLKTIPGVNKYFLEQESKIKTDKILELHRRRHGGQSR